MMAILRIFLRFYRLFYKKNINFAFAKCLKQ